MFRNVAMTEWLWWGSAALFLLVLGVVLTWLHRSHTQQKARALENKDRWARLISPLTGGSVWGAKRPPLALRVGLLYFGAMALSIMTNPIVGLLLITWAAVLWASVILERHQKRSTEEPRSGV